MAMWVKRLSRPICFKYFARNFDSARWALFPGGAQAQASRTPAQSMNFRSPTSPNIRAPEYWTREIAAGQGPMLPFWRIGIRMRVSFLDNRFMAR